MKALEIARACRRGASELLARAIEVLDHGGGCRCATLPDNELCEQCAESEELTGLHARLNNAGNSKGDRKWTEKKS